MDENEELRRAINEGRSEDAAAIVRKQISKQAFYEPPGSWLRLFETDPPPRWRETLSMTVAAGIDPGAVAPDGLLPAMVAVGNLRADALEALREEGADIHATGASEDLKRHPVATAIYLILAERVEEKRLDPLSTGEREVLRSLAHMRTHEYARGLVTSIVKNLEGDGDRMDLAVGGAAELAMEVGRKPLLQFMDGICLELSHRAELE